MCPPLDPVAPPHTPLDSTTQHDKPSSVHRSAAEHPAMPAPTMTTSQLSGRSSVVLTLSNESGSDSHREQGLLFPQPPNSSGIDIAA